MLNILTIGIAVKYQVGNSMSVGFINNPYFTSIPIYNLDYEKYFKYWIPLQADELGTLGSLDYHLKSKENPGEILLHSHYLTCVIPLCV